MSEIHGAVGSYVVHALDDDERHEFEDHLAVCETCRREVVEFSETSAQLGSLVETPPPPALRGSILSAISQVRPLPPELPAAPPGSTVSSLADHAPRRAAAPDDSRQVQATATTPQSITTTPQTGVDELALRRQQRSRRLLALATAAAVVVALVLGGFAVNLAQQRQAQVAESGRLHDLLAAPDAKIYPTKLTDGTPVSFVISRAQNRAALVGDKLPAPAPGKTYQLWTVVAKGPVPNRTFRDSGAVTTWYDGGIRDAAGLAVSLEPQGGSTSPTEILAQTLT